MPETEIPPALRGDIYCCAEAGKVERAFPPEPPEALALWLAALEATQPIAGALWDTVRAQALPHHPAGSRKAEGAFPSGPAKGAVGRWAFPYRLTGSGEAEVDFPSEPAGGTALWLSVPETAQLIAGVLWGYGRFRITSPGMESMP